MVQVILLFTALLISGYASLVWHGGQETCCQTKQVGGVTYSLASIDAKPAESTCENGCNYRKDGDDTSLFCFARGNLTVETCNEGGDETELSCQIFVVPPESTTSVVVCDGTLLVKEVNHTDTVDLNQSTITCNTPTNITNFIVGSASPGCTDLTFTISFDSIGNMTNLTYASVTPDPASLPCPLIGFDIFCIARPDQYDGCYPGSVQDGGCLCDNDCNNTVKSWEECASRCLGVVGERAGANGTSTVFWSFQGGFGPNEHNYEGNCCCKNNQGAMISKASSVMGSSKCMGAGSLA